VKKNVLADAIVQMEKSANADLIVHADAAVKNN
jgi:hypothetical protein